MTRGNKLKLVQKRRYKDAEGNDGGQEPIENPNPQDQGDDQVTDDRSKPSDKEAQLLKEVMKNKDKLKDAQAQLNAAQEALKRFEGIDPEQVRALLTEKEERERAEMEKRGEFDRVKQQMVEAHERTLGELKTGYEGKVSELQAALQAATSTITELTIGRSFGDSSFVRENLTLTPAKARVVFGSHFEVQDGGVVAYDKPAGAEGRTVLVDAAGQPLPFDQAIERIVKADPDAEHLLRSKLKSGAGSKNDPDHKPAPKVGSGRDRIAAAVNSGALNLPK